MVDYAARARKIFGGWGVTVAGVPGATFTHRNPTEENIHEQLSAVLDRSDFRVSLIWDLDGWERQV